MKEFKRLLKKHHYKLAYQALHKKPDILKYQEEPDAVVGDTHLTVLTKQGHVVGRLYGVGQDYELKSTDIKKVIEFFTVYDIPGSKQLVLDLQELVESSVVS